MTATSIGPFVQTFDRFAMLTDADLTRFHEQVQRGDGCWLWQGQRRNGYGLFDFYRGETRLRLYAHRLALWLSDKPFGPTDVVRHECDVRLCCNPSHLTAGSQGDNVRDARERGQLDTSGLTLGAGWQWQPRPCRSCDVVLPAGRQLFCAACSTRRRREAAKRRARWRD